jgi:hypothetical protein
MSSWEKEPDPTPSEYPAVWDLVLQDIEHPKIIHPLQEKIHNLLISDIRARDTFGFEKYKVRLQPFNGRNAIKDAYEELLDGVVYARQAVYEHEQKTKVVTQDSEIFKSGLTQIYVTILDSALKMRFLLERQNELENSVSKSNIIVP